MGSQSTREFTKVVIRQLPPTLEEAECKAAFDKEFANRYNWFNFARGKIGQKTTRQSTAYLNFKEPADVLSFKAAFDGATFADARGKLQPCSVEYAPFQRVPRGRVKRDPREGTIEKDAAYRAFLEELERQPEQLPTAEQQLDKKLQAGEGNDSRIVTPLMAFFQEKDAPREREKRAPPTRGKPGPRGRGLVSSALASISEAAAEDGATHKQGKAAATAASREAAAELQTSGVDSAAASDSAQAAREAARRALGALRLGGDAKPGRQKAGAEAKPGRHAAAAEAKPGRQSAGAEAKSGRQTAGAEGKAGRQTAATEAKPGRQTASAEGKAGQQAADTAEKSFWQTLTDSSEPSGESAVTGDADAQLQPKKVREKPAKEPKVRPGFGTFVPRGARQQDAGNSGGGGSGTGGSAAAATDAPASSAGSSAAARARAAAAAAQAPPRQAAQPSTQLQQQKQHRGRRASDRGDRPAADGDATEPAPQAPATRSAGSQTSEVPPVEGAVGGSRRPRGRGSARAPAASPSSADTTPASDTPPVELPAQPAAGGAAKKVGRHRSRPKKAGSADPSF